MVFSRYVIGQSFSFVTQRIRIEFLNSDGTRKSIKYRNSISSKRDLNFFIRLIFRLAGTYLSNERWLLLLLISSSLNKYRGRSTRTLHLHFPALKWECMKTSRFRDGLFFFFFQPREYHLSWGRTTAKFWMGKRGREILILKELVEYFIPET